MNTVRRAVLDPFTIALVTALRASADVQAVLFARPVDSVGPTNRVYAVGAVPASLVGRWVEVGTPSEGWAPTFMRGGSRVSLLVHLWHTPVAGDDVSAATVGVLWGAVALALSSPLALAAPHVMLAGSPTLIDVARDRDNVSWHGIVRYDAITQDQTP